MEDITNLEQLINGGPTGLSEAILAGFMSQIITWIVVPSIILSTVILVLYIVHSMRRRKIENAILEMRDILRDMNTSKTTPSPTLTGVPVSSPSASPEINTINQEN